MPPAASRARRGRRELDAKQTVVLSRRASSSARKPPNGSRLSCGRNRRWRKEVEAQRKRRAGEGNAILPYLRAPDSFKRMLGSSLRQRSASLGKCHDAINAPGEEQTLGPHSSWPEHAIIEPPGHDDEFGGSRRDGRVRPEKVDEAGVEPLPTGEYLIEVRQALEVGIAAVSRVIHG